MRKLGINLLIPSRKVSLEGARSFSVLLVMLSPFTAECVFDHQLVNWKVFQSVPHWESNTSQERNRHSILCTLECRTKYTLSLKWPLLMTLWWINKNNWKAEKTAKASRGITWRMGDFEYEKVEVLIVLLRGVNFRFWSHLGCSGETAIICSPYVAVKEKNDISV